MNREILIRCFDRTVTGAHLEMFITKIEYLDYKERYFYPKIEWIEFDPHGCMMSDDDNGKILLNRYPDKANPLQRLIDDLWNMGVRPTGVKWSTDEVNALKNHISDLKEVTTKALNHICK